MSRILFLTRALNGPPHAGDQVYTRRLKSRLQRDHEVVTLELDLAGKPERVRNLLRGWPPEMTGYATRRNRAAIRNALGGGGVFDFIYLVHESLFALQTELADSGAGIVLISTNSISLLQSSDPSRVQNLLSWLADNYEKRFYSLTDAQLVVVSETDHEWLAGRISLPRRHRVSFPGALPLIALDADAVVSRELVLTGSYAWWRKRRDLRWFARRALDMPVVVNDPLASDILGDRSEIIWADTVDWSSALRFGVVTDRFVGGFKLKVLEYISNNCMILAFSDLRRDFHDVPHADEFIRVVRSPLDVEAVVAAVMAQPQRDTLGRFREFQLACERKFDWERCLGEAMPQSGEPARSGRPRTGLADASSEPG